MPLVAYWLGLSVTWGALLTVVIPSLVDARVAPERCVGHVPEPNAAPGSVPSPPAD